MTTAQVNLSSSSNLAVPAGWVKTGTYNPQNVGVVISDILDILGASTGLSLSVVSPCSTFTGSLAWADAPAWGIPQVAYQEAWAVRSSTVNGQLRIAGFSPGQTGTLKVAGHTNSATRHTDYFVNGSSAYRYTATVKPPAEPIIIPFTADASGHVNITTNFVSVLSYINFIIIEYTVSSAPTITSLNQLRTGQASRLGFSAPYAATSASITADTITKTAAASAVDDDEVDFTVPAWVDGETCVKIGPVSVKASNGTTETAGYSATLEFWGSHPDNATPVLFTAGSISGIPPAESMDVVFGLSPMFQDGTQIIYDASRFEVSNGVIGSNTYQGVSNFGYRNPDDKIARLFTVDTTDGPEPEPESNRGLTATGLTMTGFTMKGLTVVGL